MMITENEDKVEEALRSLLDACREQVAEEGKVSAESYRNLYAECRALEVILAEKEDELETLRRRNEGMLNHLTRIRTKADMASGFTHGSLEDCALQGRAAGAEGAVDRLIALYAGALAEVKRSENLLMAAQVPEWVIKGEDSGLDG